MDASLPLHSVKGQVCMQAALRVGSESTQDCLFGHAISSLLGSRLCLLSFADLLVRHMTADLRPQPVVSKTRPSSIHH